MPKGSAGSGSVADRPPTVAGLVPAILHVDMDAFFAAVEVLDDPTLAGKPVIVGGSGARGVVASCTYEARAFGVHSAMPSVRAKQLCPHAIFIDGRHSRYAEMSRQLRDVLLSVTPLVEPIGLDEAFLDVTGARRLLGPPVAIAHRIRRQVHQELSLDCSVGVGRSKMIAKLASRAAKPTAHRGGRRPGPGVVMVPPDQELSFLHPMPVQALWGVGPATAKRLADLGIRTVGDLAALDDDVLVRRLGRAHGLHLAALARADDAEPVVPDRPAKSVGHEETFRDDIYDPATLERHAARMAESVAGHLRGANLAGRTVTVKVKFADFTLATRSHTLPLAIDTGGAIAAVAAALVDAVDPGPGVRLLGVSMSGLQPAADAQQLAFDLGGPTATGDRAATAGDRAATAGDQALRRQAEWTDVTTAVDAIRTRFGRSAVGTVAMVGDDGIAVPARRDAPWGPSADDPG